MFLIVTSNSNYSGKAILNYRLTVCGFIKYSVVRNNN